MNADGVIAVLAIDQRGAMKKMLGKYKEPTSEDIVEFKKLVSSELTKYTSAILLDPEYGIPATTQRDTSCGLLMAYERTPAMTQRSPVASRTCLATGARAACRRPVPTR